MSYVLLNQAEGWIKVDGWMSIYVRLDTDGCGWIAYGYILNTENAGRKEVEHDGRGTEESSLLARKRVMKRKRAQV